MNAFFVLLRRELQGILRERTILIAFAIQFFIASFSSVMLVGLLAFYHPVSIAESQPNRITVAMFGTADKALSEALRAAGVRTLWIPDAADAERVLSRGLVDAVFHAPDGTRAADPYLLYLPEGETRATVTMLLLQKALLGLENDLRLEQGIALRYQDLGGKNPTTFEFLFGTIVPVLMLFPGFVAGSMVIDSLTGEFEEETLDILRAAPLAIEQIIGAKLLAAGLLSVVQIALWVLLLRFNQVQLASPLLLALLAVALAGLNVTVAMAIACAFRERERAQFVYALALLLLTGLAFAFADSPLTLLVRLAAGDAYAGAADVALYWGALLLALALFFRGARRLLRPALQ